MFEEPTEQFAGYIFDCDGTLVDSMPLHYRAWVHAFKTHNAKFDFTWDIFYSYAGVGHYDSVEELNRRFNDILDPIAVTKTQFAYVDQHEHTIQSIKPVVDFAKRVALSAKLSVASGGTRKHVTSSLRVNHIDHLFPVIVTKEDVKRGKPAPDTFLLAAEKMGVDPKDCLVFEDSHLGIEAAEKAGMKSVLVRTYHK